jgi:hypothetical protein
VVHVPGTSMWTVNSMRVASHGRGGYSPATVTRHEVGHALGVMERDDHSETFADGYAGFYSAGAPGHASSPAFPVPVPR